jgi:peptidoglycan/xylan/chitin deacetylase (PgdA/CDA1 family)
LTETVRAGVGIAALGSAADTSLAASRGERLVVLTFDDAVATHRTFVAPLLKELGFGATFFVTHCWMATDPQHFMTWDQIAEIHQMGFEIGNHSWTHPDFSRRRDAARLATELALVERELDRVHVPRPVSFAWCGNQFCPEAIQELSKLGYQFARRGMQPEVPYGKIEVGPTFDPRVHHHLLIPSTGDAYPGWTLAHFQRVVERAGDGQPVVLQFHGVPDVHPWVSTPPERFREYMAYLKKHDFRVIPLRDLKKLLPGRPPADPLLKTGFPEMKQARGEWPTEIGAARTDLG